MTGTIIFVAFFGLLIGLPLVIALFRVVLALSRLTMVLLFIPFVPFVWLWRVLFGSGTTTEVGAQKTWNTMGNWFKHANRPAGPATARDNFWIAAGVGNMVADKLIRELKDKKK